MRSVIFVLFIFIFGCSPEASIDSLPDGKVVVEKFIKGFQSNEYSSLDSLYADEFWQSIPKDTWSKILPNMKAELGNIERCELSQWNQSTAASTNRSGNYVTLQYHCEHEKYDSTMVFVVFKPLSGGDSKIITQNITSIGFLIE